jgi:hypothetical protein
VPASAVAAHAERQDVGMFDEEERVGNAPRAALVDERSLERERLRIGHASESTHIEGPRRLTHQPLLPVPPILPS